MTLKQLRIICIVIGISGFAFTQDYNIAMSVYKSDVQNNVYEKDSTANALIIYDYGNSYIDEKTFNLKFQIKQKLKILRSEGKEEGVIEIRLYKGKSSKEQISNIRGATYNIENNDLVKTELSKKSIFREENEKYSLIKLVLPNVKVGSIITYSYETSSPFVRKFQPWYFQGKHPVLYSEYNTSIPGNYIYHTKLVGTIPLKTNEARIEKRCIELGRGASADCSISKYVMVDIPAYKPEEFTTTPLNYMARLEYELSVVKGFDGSVEKLTKSWESVDSQLKSSSDFGRQIGKKSLVKNVLPAQIKDINNPLEKAKAIRQFVLDSYRWNEKYGANDVSIKTMLKENVGNAFEINLLLQNLLESEGFEVFPVLLSTRGNGFATKIFPVITDFNYVIVKLNIDGNTYYLDATEPYLTFGELPFRCLNHYGRVIDFDNVSYWEDINVSEFSSQQHRIKLKAEKNDVFTGTLENRYVGYHAHDLKRRFDENPSEFIKRKTDSYLNFTIKDYNIKDFDKTQNYLKEEIRIKIENEIIGNKVYFKPFLFKFFERNPFRLQQRTYPIDFGYKDTYNYMILIDLSDKYQILELPETVNINLPNNQGTFMFRSELKGNQLSIYYRVLFNSELYGSEYYDALKVFMDKIIETQKNTIVVLERQ